jgi:hypothetical protein
MITKQRRIVPARATPASLPAPVGGWNARDALGEMAPMDAVSLTNFYPATTDVMVRNGHTHFATGIVGQVETLFNYSGGATTKLFAIAAGSIYDVTAGGAVGAASVTGLTNSRWQYVNNTTTGGSYLQAVNGLDKMRVFDGTNWHADGDGAPYNITGVDSATLSNLTVHKFRVWFTQKNTLKAWYLATSAIGGAATAFDLSGTAQLGGYLVSMFTWTIDAGYGVDDLAAFITSMGEVIVYRGTDPSSASTWALVGVWRIGAPIGNRPCIKFSGDMLIICQDGVYPMSGALQSSRTNPKIAVTDKIQFAVSSAISLYGSNFGWQLLQFPKENMLILNVPVQAGQNQQQYVMNTINKSWCNFTGWEANCWELFEEDPYFGGNGFVAKAWDGLSDNGTNIAADGLQAFNYFGSPGQLKRCTMIRPTLFTDGTPSAFTNVNVDFDLNDTTAPLSFTGTIYGVWDVGLWDSAVWGGDLNVSRQWQGATGLGYAFAPRLKTASQGIHVQWVATDLVFERGGIL